MNEDIFSTENYNNWNSKKIVINNKESKLYFKEGDIWWCSVGLNIGSESSGKGNDFRRPVLIYKKLSSDLFVAIPLSSKNKLGTWFSNISFQNKEITALLYQIKTLNRKRLSLKMGELDEKDFAKVKEKLEQLLEPSSKCHPSSLRIDGRIPKSTYTISNSKNMSSKKVLLFGDSLTWGAIAGKGNFRFEKKDRIAGILQQILGGDFDIIEEGRPGRTIATEDRAPSRNGITSFENAIASHMPLDYIFIMLGTNDVKKKFGERSAEEIANGFIEYRNVVDKFNRDWEVDFNPRVVIVAPPVIDENYLPEHYKTDFTGSRKVSEKLAAAYRTLTKEKSELGFDSADASKVKVSSGDGVHLEPQQNREVAELYLDYIKQYESI